VEYRAKKLTFFFIAYYHDPRLIRKVGGLIRVFDLADNLVKSGHQVTLFLPKLGAPRKQTLAEVVEVPFVDIPLLRPLSFHFISTILLLVNMTTSVDFLYVRQMNSFLPLFLAKLYHIPTIFEIPNDPYLAYQSYSLTKRSIIRFTDRLSMLMADMIIVLSKWSRQRITQFGKIPLSRISVLPSGTDTVLFRPLSKEDCCARLGLDPSFLYVGFVGSFLSHQGVETLIDSAPRVLANCAHLRFLLVGDGPMMRAWQKKVSEKGLQTAFSFCGQIPYQEVPEYIGAMDICVAPHRKDTNQASPVKIFDYMACARPIVASDIEVIREIVEDSGCAVLVAPERPDQLAMAIISLLKDEKAAKAMSLKAREYVVTRFDRRKISEELIQTLETLPIE
jgi:glycosyltransferase involved in cell wall biosynthesis